MTSSGVAAEIKSKLSVVDVVGETVQLKRAGSSYKGLCPFHAEKTPSFVVTPDRESWRCFGCGEGGDIFTFLMKRDGLDFREALSRLAEKAGVELSERTAREDRRKRRLREALEAAIAWYREVLLRTPQAERARAYLQERGFSDETLERFTIGYAPNNWDALTRRFTERGFTNEELIAAGLASPSNRGGVIDKFRGRIIIPIRDASRRPVGLGGRILPGAEGPKYLNSPAGPLFDKSRTLFGIDLARAAIRREKLTVIVEGYTDVMAAHQAGFQNVVASLGTALTQGQVELATRYADAIALAYDVDLAGEAATQRGLLEELGPDQSVSKVRVVRIPAGKDPDELIRTDPDAWREAVASAKPVIEYFLERTAAEFGLDTVAGKREVTGRALALLKRVVDPIERNLYLQRLAQMVQVEERILAEALRREPVRRASQRPVPAASGTAAAVPVTGLSPLESEALALLLRHPGLAAGVETLPAFRDATAAALAQQWRAHVSGGKGNGTSAADLEAFVAGLDPATADLARHILERIRLRGEEAPLDAELAREALRVTSLRLRVLQLEDALRDGRLLLEEAQRDGDSARLQAIEQQLMHLGREKAEATRAIHQPAAAAAGTRRS
ncbi:MAG TPA: DNA primase [candidate division Zixibacteria bacterium]|nr:DNA primase [candidate division Zixibacteria bacterium]